MGAQSVYSAVRGVQQKNDAEDLKVSKFIPEELLMNRDLSMQQAYSRRAPGQANAEEQIRRNQANQVSNALRMSGGDANKVAAVSSASTAQANDSTARLQAQGQAFSEDAFRRLYQSNIEVARQKRKNYDDYQKAKAALLSASDQNMYSGVSGLFEPHTTF